LELIIESYSQEQYEIIKSDLLSIIDNIDRKIGFPANLKKILLVVDFDATVNKLQNSDSYTSFRNQQAVGKTVTIEDGSAIVISYIMYSDIFDQCDRYLLIIHELIHVFNKNRFIFLDTKSPSMNMHIENLYCLFDEYYANRKAYEFIDIIFDQKTKLFNKHIAKSFSGHIELLINNHYYDSINAEIASYRITFDRETLLDNIIQYFDEASKDIVYAYALLDHYSRLKRVEPVLKKSKIINDKTTKLIEYFRLMYLTDDLNNDINLKDGLPLIKRYMTNFGFVTMDVPGGIYHYFLDS
jgi:hypothetical protein